MTDTVEFKAFSNGKNIRDLFFLLALCLAGTTTYFIYDVPASIGLDLKLVLNQTNEEFTTTYYSSYGILSALAALCSGYLITNLFGLERSAYIFTGVAALSQLRVISMNNVS